MSVSMYLKPANCWKCLLKAYLAWQRASLPVEIKLPPLMISCLSSQVGVVKSSQTGWIQNFQKGQIGVIVCCHTLPTMSQKSPILNIFTGLGDIQYSMLMFPTDWYSQFGWSEESWLLIAYHQSSVGRRVQLPVFYVLQLQKALASRLVTSAGQSQGIAISWKRVLSLQLSPYFLQKRGMVGLMEAIHFCPSWVQYSGLLQPPSLTNLRYSPLETSIWLAWNSLTLNYLTPNQLSQPQVTALLLVLCQTPFQAGTVIILFSGMLSRFYCFTGHSIQASTDLMNQRGARLMITAEVSRCILQCSMPMRRTHMSLCQFSILSMLDRLMTSIRTCLTCYLQARVFETEGHSQWHQLRSSQSISSTPTANMVSYSAFTLSLIMPQSKHLLMQTAAVCPQQKIRGCLRGSGRIKQTSSLASIWNSCSQMAQVSRKQPLMASLREGRPWMRRVLELRDLCIVLRS